MKISKLLATAVLMCLAACAVKDDKASKVALHANNDGAPTGEVSSKVLPGGQPGKVNIMGVLVVDDAEKGGKTLKSGISLNLMGGKALDGKVAEVTAKPQDSLSQNQNQKDTDVEKAETESTYLNVGCSEDQIDKTYTNGLTAKELGDVKDATSVRMTAKVVFICGNVGLRTISAAIKADKLILDSVNLVNMVAAGAVDVAANSLVLKGQNRIGTMGVDTAGEVVDAPILNMNVIKDVTGDGTLMLTSQGGNVISAVEDAAKSKDTSAEKLQRIHDKNEEAQMKSGAKVAADSDSEADSDKE
ncbi:hypothetical protein DOM22_13540 [Bdellovibrio sp. ZAP7]|uniref:hypothetical protein n=1 Tax=Bdellovibrio sp. ZAP7 TaxID=2231053 RepID=UPI00115C2B8B|nr:hypothetical protein [Bdellovibrio sp. ZAP7]QDK46109.1 hypothetical protein DOM22_13540 [Bdellovibrio sp. ZAP7]